MTTIDPLSGKSEYYKKRKSLNLTRDEACELITALMMTPDRLEKIENERYVPHDDEVLAIAEAYKAPELANYYCRHDCKIGAKYVDEAIPKALPQIAIETVNSVNKLGQIKERLLEIVEDGQISNDEYEDFKTIKDNLDKLVRSAESLKLWINQNGLKCK